VPQREGFRKRGAQRHGAIITCRRKPIPPGPAQLPAGGGGPDIPAAAMRTQIDIGVMSYAGLTDVRSQFFYEIDDDPQSHEEHLRLAYDIGRTFLAPERA
jgi:hypothetical protein